MSTIPSKDRASLCLHAFADGRRCLTPRTSAHPHLCTYHAHKESQTQAAQKVGRHLGTYFSGHYLSACDLSSALGHLFSAAAQGQIKPKTASTLAYLAQILLQSIHLANTNTSTPSAQTPGAKPSANPSTAPRHQFPKPASIPNMNPTQTPSPNRRTP